MTGSTKRRQIRRVAHVAAISLIASVLLPAMATATPPRNEPVPSRTAGASRPQLSFANAGTQTVFGTAYQRALRNLLDVNTVVYDPGVYNQSGLMTDPPGTFIRAGGGYPQPWTRDGSVNPWNAASQLEPDVAKNTLWSNVRRQSDGQLIVVQDDQWWDQVVWVTAAWNHYLVTGDRGFLTDAYETAINTLNLRKSRNYNASYGLFEGPSFFNDGIAGYPAPPADATDSRGSGVLQYPTSDTMMTLSTNALYYEAYRTATAMGQALGKPAADVTPLEAAASELKAKINQHFWIPDKGRYGYLIHNGDSMSGTLDESEEGTGLSFAVLFGIADAAQSDLIMKNTDIQPWGIVDVYPHFARYDDAHPGRHNVSVWPLVQGFWASAAARTGAQTRFSDEVSRLAKLADSNSGFWEIYNAGSGIVDGGWQSGFHWGSQPDQTWSATAYLRMIYDGVFGMRFTPEGLAFRPTLPTGWGDTSLTGVAYRSATLDIHLHGSGNIIRSFQLDGVSTKNYSVPTALTGRHTIDVMLTGGVNADRDHDGIPDAGDRCPDVAGSRTYAGCPDPGKLEAEDAITDGGAKVNDNHTGYSGRGFLDGIWNPGASATFNVNVTSASARQYDVTLRYANANASPRTLSMYINGTKVRQISFSPLRDWDTWSTESETVTLNARSNTITYRWDDGDSGRVNLDRVSVSPR